MVLKEVKRHGENICGRIYVPKDLIGKKVVIIPHQEFGILFNCEKCGFEQSIDLDYYFQDYLKEK